MRRAAFAALAVVAAAGLLARSAAPVAACSCIPTNVPPAERADTVVIGTVVRMEGDIATAPGLRSGGLTAVVAVERYIKGSGPEEIFVEDAAVTCAYFIESPVGGRHQLFLDGASSPFRTGYCSGNAPLSPGESAIQGSPTATPSRELSIGKVAEEDDGVPGSAIGAGIAIPVVLLLGAAFVWWRRSVEP